MEMNTKLRMVMQSSSQTGAKHNVLNIDNQKDLKMYTLYAPPHHKDGIVRATKKEAEDNEAEFDGKTTE